LRSALDQTVWGLARLRGIPVHTQFPVITEWNTDTRKRFERQTEGVPDEAIYEIKSLQPYHRGAAYKTHPLWRLDEMCNLDKHRRIPAHGSVAEVFFPNMTPSDLASGLVKTETTDDRHIMSVPISLKHKLDLSPNVSMAVTFGGDQSGIEESIEGISEIHDFVRDDVLPRFDRFFP
jgi:hypothetical protein